MNAYELLNELLIALGQVKADMTRLQAERDAAEDAVRRLLDEVAAERRRADGLQGILENIYLNTRDTEQLGLEQARWKLGVVNRVSSYEAAEQARDATFGGVMCVSGGM